jgi:hypothetical protein
MSEVRKVDQFRLSFFLNFTYNQPTTSPKPMSFDANKLTESAATGLQAAIQLARDNAHSQISPAHLLSALLTSTPSKSAQTLKQAPQSPLHVSDSDQRPCRRSS